MPPKRDEIVVASLIHDPAVVEDEDRVRFADRAQPVRDHDPGASERL